MHARGRSALRPSSLTLAGVSRDSKREELEERGRHPIGRRPVASAARPEGLTRARGPAAQRGRHEARRQRREELQGGKNLPRELGPHQ